MDRGQHLIANASHAAGAYYLVGVAGDDNPERALERLTFVNDGTVKLCVGVSLTGVRGSRKLPVPAGAAIAIEGPAEHLVVHNPHASTAGSWGLWAETVLRNSGEDAGERPSRDSAEVGTRYLPARATFTANAVATKTIRFGRRETITHLKVEALAAFTGAGTIQFDLRDEDGTSLLTAVLNLKTLVAKTLTSVTLTATTSLLTIPAGKSVTLRVSSTDAGDAGGPLAVELGLAA